MAIASPDKDFFQLLRPGLVLLRPPPKKSASAAATPRAPANKYSLVPYTEDDFRQDWSGLSPLQFVDMLALSGDASDNVPGIQGIGPKTASALLQAHSTLEAIFSHAESAKPRRAVAALASAEGAAAARLSRQLVQICTDLDLPPAQVPLDSFRLQLPSDKGTQALQLLAQLEFKTHSQRLLGIWKRLAA